MWCLVGHPGSICNTDFPRLFELLDHRKSASLFQNIYDVETKYQSAWVGGKLGYILVVRSNDTHSNCSKIVKDTVWGFLVRPLNSAISQASQKNTNWWRWGANKFTTSLLAGTSFPFKPSMDSYSFNIFQIHYLDLSFMIVT